MTQYDFSSLPRPGIRTRGQIAAAMKLRRQIDGLRAHVAKLKCEGHTRLAAQQSEVLSFFVHEFMRATGKAP